MCFHVALFGDVPCFAARGVVLIVHSAALGQVNSRLLGKREHSSTQTCVCSGHSPRFVTRTQHKALHLDMAWPCLYYVQEEVDKVLQRAHWDDESEMWVLEHLSDTHPAASLMAGGGGSGGGSQQLPYGLMPGSSRPFAVPGLRRPVSAFTKAALMSGDMNPRFRWVPLCLCCCTSNWLGVRLTGVKCILPVTACASCRLAWP